MEIQRKYWYIYDYACKCQMQQPSSSDGTVWYRGSITEFTNVFAIKQGQNEEAPLL